MEEADAGKKKKIALIALFSLVILVLLGLIALAFFSQKTSSTIAKQPVSTVNVSPNALPSESADQQTNTQASWITGQGATYTIAYPPDWQVSVASISGGGTAATFQTAGSEFPRFYIEEAATQSATPIADRLQTLSWMHLPESQVTVQGITGISLSGTVPMNPLPDSANQSHINKTYLFFEKNSTQYVITESYYEDIHAQANKKLLNLILASLKLN